MRISSEHLHVIRSSTRGAAQLQVRQVVSVHTGSLSKVVLVVSSGLVLVLVRMSQ